MELSDNLKYPSIPSYGGAANHNESSLYLQVLGPGLWESKRQNKAVSLDPYWVRSASFSRKVSGSPDPWHKKQKTKNKKHKKEEIVVALAAGIIVPNADLTNTAALERPEAESEPKGSLEVKMSITLMT